VEQILAIAPILPDQGKGTAKEPYSTASDPRSAANTDASSKRPPTENLIDLDSRPPSTAPPQSTSTPTPEQPTPLLSNPMHPTSHPQQPTPLHQSTVVHAPVGNAPKQANLLDDDHDITGMDEKMSNLNMNHEPMMPLKRTDTETNETDVFVDAES
jgi:hypothetical protein